MAVAPMNAHFIWWDGSNLQETHINNILNNIDQIPEGIASGFLILVLRYCDPITLEEINPKIGHWIGGRDHYYVNLRPPVNAESVEYAMWDNPVTGQTIANVFELQGFGIETIRQQIRVNTFPNNRVFDGIAVSDTIWEQARTMSNGGVPFPSPNPGK